MAGGFVAGLIIPHDNGFAVALVERFEDLVSIILIPLVCHSFHSIVDVTGLQPMAFYRSLTFLFQYFTLSGLKTNLGLLNNGITWGYTILLCVVSFSAKFLPCSIAAKFCGFSFRESGAIGALMSCKGYFSYLDTSVELVADLVYCSTVSSNSLC